jgi:hypothetical protein
MEVMTKGRVTTTVRAIVRYVLNNFEEHEQIDTLTEVLEDVISNARRQAFDEAVGIARNIETGTMTGARTISEAIETHKQLST